MSAASGPGDQDVLGSLRQSSGREATTLLLTEDHLISEVTHGPRRWRRSWLLRDLSPEVDSSSGRPEHTEASLWAGTVLVALAASLYFSDFHAKIPLLAPLLAIFGLWPLWRALRNWRVETWTIFRHKDGSTATHVLHRGSHPGEREAFERLFADTVRRVHRSYPD